MNCKRCNAITLSPALVGLAVALLAPAAHGHGNNPKVTGHTGGDWPSDPPGRGPSINLDVVDPYTQVGGAQAGGAPRGPFDVPGGLGDAQSTLIVISFGDATAASATGLSIGALSQQPAIVLAPIAPPADLAALRPDDSFDSFNMTPDPGLINIPMTRAIPSPGTLALLGLAAALLRRRRRGLTAPTPAHRPPDHLTPDP